MAGALGAVLLRFVWPSWPSVIPRCQVRELTALHCPGCGGTRCAIHLLDGDIAGAFAMNAAVALIAVVMAVVVPLALWREWKGGSYRVFPTWLAYTMAGMLIVFGLVRNLPWWPFTLLVPH